MENILFKTKYKAWHTKKKQWHYFTFSDLVAGRALENGTILWYEQWQQISHFPTTEEINAVNTQEEFSADAAHHAMTGE